LAERNIMTDQKRLWLKVFAGLLILIPGLPYVLLALALVLRPFNLQEILFVPGLVIFNAYFTLPALIFGNGLYPSESFGYLPGPAGFILAAILYGIISFGMAFPISAGIQKLKSK